MVSEQHIYEDFVTIFDELDSTSKGYITLPELIEKIKRFGYRESDAVMKDIFEQADTSRDGKLTQEEFVNAIRICPPEMHRMNVAKKSTSKSQRFNGNMITSTHGLETIINDLTTEELEDVIICDSPPPLISNGSALDHGTERVNGGTKRSIESSPNNNAKRLKANHIEELPVKNSLNLQVYRTKRLQSIIQKELKSELARLQENLNAKYAKEILDLRMTVNFWKRKSQELKQELFALHKEMKVEGCESASLLSKSPATSAHVIPTKADDSTGVKNRSPCFLPPASANAVLSLHLKNLHKSSNNANGSVVTSSCSGNYATSQKSAAPSPKISAIDNNADNAKTVIDLTDDIDDTSDRTNITNKHKIDDRVTPMNILVVNKHNKIDNLCKVNGNLITEAAPHHMFNTKASNSSLSSILVEPLPPPLPKNQPAPPGAKNLPSRPILEYNMKASEIELKWTCDSNQQNEEAVSYHLFSCHNKLPWKRVGTISAMPLPMACLIEKSKVNRQMYFLLRGVDKHGRVGPFSDVININQDDNT
ncbi:hypothetical protein HELRODRAFT_163488 [Helobdella robusta]|uniref:EF-hand domain-containing protein n=1 Tax=Helobdella robusta TaxID=6412 RepID=T1EU43_HELRO|nr:hypothetical protein HELRODRAFT_163488 [Helobdella robusta]ESN96428.1 hypothetical protein HELRODRAFT_163488 [Helobdella robusta]